MDIITTTTTISTKVNPACERYDGKDWLGLEGNSSDISGSDNEGSSCEDDKDTDAL